MQRTSRLPHLGSPSLSLLERHALMNANLGSTLSCQKSLKQLYTKQGRTEDVGIFSLWDPPLETLQGPFSTIQITQVTDYSFKIYYLEELPEASA